MARIRTIKPEFFLHEELFDAEAATNLPLRVAFIGLWTQADREGRFEWRPRRLKAAILPYDDVDMARVLHALATRGFIAQYACEGREFGVIPSFPRHQVINNREADSEIPAPPETLENPPVLTRDARVDDPSGTREVHAQAEGKGKEGKGKEGNNSPTGAPDFVKGFWSRLERAEAKGVRSSLMGRMLKSMDICDAIDALDYALTQQDPSRYIGGILKARAPSQRKADLPPAIKAHTDAGEPVTAQGNGRWKVGWDVMNERGEVVGF